MLPLVILLNDMKQNVLPQEMHVSNTKVLPIWLMQKWFIHLFRIVRERCIRHGQFDIQGGGLGFWSGPKYFFKTKSEQDYFFCRPFGPVNFFFRTENYIYNIQAFATTLCLIQAFATTSCFRDNLILKFKAFALYSHSIQVFATSTDCSSRNNHIAS